MREKTIINNKVMHTIQKDFFLGLVQPQTNRSRKTRSCRHGKECIHVNEKKTQKQTTTVAIIITRLNKIKLSAQLTSQKIFCEHIILY